MVLTDDNFVSIYAAVEEGRVTFDNLRKVTFFLLSTERQRSRRSSPLCFSVGRYLSCPLSCSG
jgi:hypothetical protein